MARPSAPDDPLIYLIAGEASGDVLGAGLIRELRAATGGRVRIAGVGGELMAGEGMESLFPISEMAVMGIFEILPYARKAFKRIRQTVEDILERQPVAVVSIDSKAFSLRVQKRLKNRRDRGRGPDIPLIHMVAPTVWAWRPGRAKTIAKFLDHLLVLFPFEPPYFEAHGLATTFVGHPAVDQPVGNGIKFRERHSIPSDVKVLGILPGSRPGEVRRLLPVFSNVVETLVEQYPGLRIVVPTVGVVAETVRAAVADWPGSPVVVEGHEQKYDAFDALDLALAASGTVTLELTLARVPTAVAYKVSPLSSPIGRLLVDLEAVVLTNRIAGRRVLPLFLQEECTPELIVPALSELLDEQAKANEQRRVADSVAISLRAGDAMPSKVAAEAVLKVAGL
ncbi:MAG: lipid-A-disaccharide synthase [Rhodospirillaceae bacterium]|jgi:lipid-A-disaccharide synthase|nr:lipid-A-disaccharide synthase [Rhodospirillaceae bacterium]MBT6138554.1 lipid-A-disaccharide synthase [Rhodospirillaceae bacterium]